MARLYGERKSPLPVLIGVALLALVGIGGYYMYQNRGADVMRVAPGEVTVVDNTPGNMASNGEVDAERNGNTVTVGSENAGDATDKSASGAASADGANTADNPANTDMSGHADAKSGTVNDSANGAHSESGAMSGSETSSTEEAGVRERSKTITNEKTGTTVTYKKKVSEDGSVTREKTQTDATPAATSSGP
jgi:hypothetical protein